MKSKKKVFGVFSGSLETILINLELQMKSTKKKVLSVFYGSLETYTRYSWVADEEQKKRP